MQIGVDFDESRAALSTISKSPVVAGTVRAAAIHRRTPHAAAVLVRPPPGKLGSNFRQIRRRSSRRVEELRGHGSTARQARR